MRRDEAGYYVARCEELPAAMTHGKTEEDAIRRIKEAIYLVLQNGREQANNRPTVKTIELVVA
jgi:predicted RNase H-like HicB family nuclease